MENQAARCLLGKVFFTWKQHSLISFAVEFKDECGTGALALAVVGLGVGGLLLMTCGSLNQRS